MDEKKKFPARKELDAAFHFLQDQITKITVEEEAEMICFERKEKNGEN